MLRQALALLTMGHAAREGAVESLAEDAEPLRELAASLRTLEKRLASTESRSDVIESRLDSKKLGLRADRPDAANKLAAASRSREEGQPSVGAGEHLRYYAYARVARIGRTATGVVVFGLMGLITTFPHQTKSTMIYEVLEELTSKDLMRFEKQM